MMKTKISKQHQAFSEVMGCINPDATYSGTYGLRGRADSMARWIGLDVRVEYWSVRLTRRQALRIRRLARQLGADLPGSFLRALEALEERRKWVVFENQHGDRIALRADWSQAASQIMARYDDGDVVVTPFQVGYAGHSPLEACRLIARWGGQ